MHIVIVTGLSGAGKSTALRALEDYGFYCVDNLPLPLARQLVDWMSHSGGVDKLALSIDARQERYLPSHDAELDHLLGLGHRIDVLFLSASEECLKTRYTTTRRRHPLSGTDVTEGIRRDREILATLQERADADVIDTTKLDVHQLKAIIQTRCGEDESPLSVILLSFGFKYGLPTEANMVFDVRFLPNPYFVPELEPCDGRDPGVAAYVFEPPRTKQLVDSFEALLRFTLPQFREERKLYLTVAVGCTGGRHRSVAVVEELGRRIADEWDVLIKHRDLDLRT